MISHFARSLDSFCCLKKGDEVLDCWMLGQPKCSKHSKLLGSEDLEVMTLVEQMNGLVLEAEVLMVMVVTQYVLVVELAVVALVEQVGADKNIKI